MWYEPDEPTPGRIGKIYDTVTSVIGTGVLVAFTFACPFMAIHALAKQEQMREQEGVHAQVLETDYNLMFHYAWTLDETVSENTQRFSQLQADINGDGIQDIIEVRQIEQESDILAVPLPFPPYILSGLLPGGERSEIYVNGELVYSTGDRISLLGLEDFDNDGLLDVKFAQED